MSAYAWACGDTEFLLPEKVEVNENLDGGLFVRDLFETAEIGLDKISSKLFLVEGFASSTTLATNASLRRPSFLPW